MNVILMGAQGAGKGTQADLVSPRLGVVKLATGDLFRSAVASGNELGLAAKGYLDRGELVPDDVTIGIVKARLQDIAREQAAGLPVRGALFDGFPRTRAQAESLDAALAEQGRRIDAVIEVDVPMVKLVDRLAGRRVCPCCGATYHVDFNPPRQPDICDRCGCALIQRSDDQPEAIRRRLDLYVDQTAPLLAYYRDRNLLTQVDGDRPIGEVTNSILAAINSATDGQTC